MPKFRSLAQSLVGALAAVAVLCVATARPAFAQATQPAGQGESDRPEAPDSVRFTRDLVYGKGGGEELKLDLSRPKDAAHPAPAILVIHGGGWSGGDKSAHDTGTWELAKRGYVAAAVAYRLAPAHRFPAQVQDVKCAVRFLRANAAKYGIDPDRIGAVGVSAGGHLSLMLATTTPADGLEGEGGWPDASSAVQAVVSFFGPTDLTAPDLPDVSRGILKNFLGGALADKPDAYRQASPAAHVSRSSAPMLLFQGTADPLVPPTQAYRMADAMTRAGARGRVEVLVGAGHGWGGAEMSRTYDEAVAFFDTTLKGGSGH